MRGIEREFAGGMNQLASFVVILTCPLECLRVRWNDWGEPTRSSCPRICQRDVTMGKRWMPRAMRVAPKLDSDWFPDEVRRYHILTPYPATPLFRQMQAEGRLLHQDWSRYDTAHVVFQPKNMSPERLMEGYEWCYERLFSHASIWRRRPSDRSAVLSYLAMSYLYKRSNLFWHLLIKYRLTHAAWRPLVELTRRRHLKFRKRLAAREATDDASDLRSSTIVSAGV